MPNKNQYRKISIVTVGDSIGLIHSLTVAHAILCELLASFFTTSGIIHAILLHEAQPPLKLVCRIFFFCGSAGRLRLEHRLFLWPNKKIFLIIEEDIDCMQTPAVYTLVFWLTFFSCSMEPKLHWSRLVTMYLDGISLFSGKLIFLLWSSIAGFNPTSGCTSIVRMQVPETSSVSLELLMIVGKLVFGAQLFYRLQNDTTQLSSVCIVTSSRH